MQAVDTVNGVIEAIADVNMRSAIAKDICIFEISTLGDLITFEKAEAVRKLLEKNKTHIRQLTNINKMAAWTENESLAKRQRVKYVSPTIFPIQNEILVFDDIVATYRLELSPFYFEVKDALYANTMRSVFNTIWLAGDSLLLATDGSSLSKQYLPLNSEFEGIPVIIYPAKDDGVLTKAFDRKEKGSINAYVDKLIRLDAAFIDGADMVIAIVWNQGNTPYCDIWKVTRNTYSDDSGFLYDVRIYKDTEVITNMGVASGNTSIVLTAEEMLLRELILLKGLSFKEAADRSLYRPHFPIGYVPDEEFYQEQSYPRSSSLIS